MEEVFIRKLAEEARKIKMTKEESLSMKNALLLKIQKNKKSSKLKSPYFSAQVFFQRSFAILTILALFFGLSKPIAAKSLPGGLLYPIKIIHEEIELSTIKDKKEKALYQITRTKKRVNEIKELKKEHKLNPKIEKDVVKTIKEHIQDTKKSIKEIEKKDPENALKISTMLVDTLKEGKEIIAEEKDEKSENANDQEDRESSQHNMLSDKKDVSSTEKEQKKDVEEEKTNLSNNEGEKTKTLENTKEVKPQDEGEDETSTDDSKEIIVEQNLIENKEDENISEENLNAEENNSTATARATKEEETNDKELDKILTAETKKTDEKEDVESIPEKTQETTREENSLLSVFESEAKNTEEIKKNLEKKLETQIKEEEKRDEKDIQKNEDSASPLENKNPVKYEEKENVVPTAEAQQEKEKKSILTLNGKEYCILKLDDETEQLIKCEDRNDIQEMAKQEGIKNNSIKSVEGEKIIKEEKAE